MHNQIFRTDDLGLPYSRQVLKACVARDKEVTLVGATENEDIVGMRQSIPEGPHSWEKRFRLSEIQRQHMQMIPNSVKPRPASGICEEQFLKHNWIDREAKTAMRFAENSSAAKGSPRRYSMITFVSRNTRGRV